MSRSQLGQLFQNGRGSVSLGISLNNNPLPRVSFPSQLQAIHKAKIQSRQLFNRSMVKIVNEPHRQCGSCPSH